MLKEFAKAVGRKLTGDNILIRETAGTYFKDGKHLRAILLTLYARPMNNIMKKYKAKTVKRYNIITSRSYYSGLQELLTVGKAEGFELVRVGKDNDGGYIMLNDFGGGIAYSFGISDDVSWDKDMASRGYDVYMYDHTVGGLPEENPRFHWSKLGISDGMTQDDRLKSLEELIALNGHEGKRDMILKMDVEGAEWGFLESVKPETLAQFGQMTFEIHNMVNPEEPERVLSILRKINATHQLVHIHANNAGYYVSTGGKNFASLLEVSYVLRDKYKIAGEYDVDLPLGIDMPNLVNHPEIDLGRWNVKTEIDEHFSLIVCHR